MDGDVVAEQRTASNRKVSSAPRVLSEGRTVVPQTALTSGVSLRINRSSPSLQSRAPARPTAAQAQKLHRSKPQTSQAEHSMKSSSSKSKPSACPTDQTPRTSKTSIKTPTSMSQKPNCFTNVHKSKPHCGSPRLLSSPLLLHSQTEIPKSPHAPVSFPPDVSLLSSARPLIPEEHLSPSPSFSLRSTFIVSPSGSTESALLPKVYQSTPFQKGSDSSLLPEQPQSPWLFPEPMSSLKLSQLPPSNLESSRQSHRSLCEPESLLLVNQLQLPLSPVSSSPNTPPKSLEPSPAVNSLSRLSLFKSPLDAYSRSSSTPTDEDAPLIMSSTPISGDHESDLSLSCIPSPPSHRLNVILNPPLAEKTEEEEELSIDSGDEMSSDSLDLAPYEEDSSDGEALTDGHLTREEEPGIPAIPHQEDLQTDEQEQLSEPSMVMHKLGLSAGSGSERPCDLDGFLPLGLDMNSGHSDTPEHTYCDSVRTRETTPYDSGPTGSEGYWPSGSLSTGAGHRVFSVMEDSQTLPTGIQIHSTTPTRRGEILANKPGTSECGKSTPPLSWVPAACSQSNPRSGSELGPAFRPLSRVAQEIMEICNVDQMGCEDPDLDTDTTSHTLHELEQELRLMAKESGKQVSVFGGGSSGSRDQQANHHFTWGRVSEEQKEEEAAAQRDQLSVLLLP
ncbi:hypothetical protein D9C73_015333 [Collichthys lucidus]|uniref:Uncharacterized protein n=1 Tax=Collichthys lucidus TaxID=240159 RepID=A0A4U5V1G7_COLLU|nr:hypothetical protein D9C73_015333 [Collichthys lucidus]